MLLRLVGEQASATLGVQWSGRRLGCRSGVLAVVGARIGMRAVSGVAVRRAVVAAVGSKARGCVLLRGARVEAGEECDTALGQALGRGVALEGGASDGWVGGSE